MNDEEEACDQKLRQLETFSNADKCLRKNILRMIMHEGIDDTKEDIHINMQEE